MSSFNNVKARAEKTKKALIALGYVITAEYNGGLSFGLSTGEIVNYSGDYTYKDRGGVRRHSWAFPLTAKK